jgi:hypothetical protein
MHKVRGRLDAFFETGTEGVIWSVIDPRLPAYDALWTLRDGDHLTIIGRQNETLWEGTIQLEYERNWEPYPHNPQYGQQAVGGFWVHGLQVDLAPDDWAIMFAERYRAIMIPGPHQDAAAPHPFLGPATGMRERLQRLADPEPLYRQALYAWLHYMSNGEYYSLARDLGFTLDETLALIGGTSEQITARQDAIDWEMFVRVALLWGVYGALDWKFHDKDDAARWLRETCRKSRLLSGIDGIAEVRDELITSDAS